MRKNYPWPDKTINEYWCDDKGGCDLYFRTDYDYSEVVCPHCESLDNLVHLNSEETDVTQYYCSVCDFTFKADYDEGNMICPHCLHQKGITKVTDSHDS